MNAQLTPEEILRYSRHLTLPEVGLDGQEKLKNSSALLVGCGGLGSPVALYLAAAGVGRLGLLDFDLVDLSNLQRQVAFTSQDVGRPKVEAVKERLRSMNPHVQVTSHRTKLDANNALAIFKEYDVIVDGSDNFPTRYLVNDACVLLGKPDISGSVLGFEGQASVFWAREGPCYRCLFPEPPAPGAVPSCAEGGVLGLLPGTIGLIQATEVVKWILGQGDLLIGRLLLYKGLEMKFREVPLPKDPDCPVCGQNPTLTRLVDYAPAGCAASGAQATLATGGATGEITAQELKARIDRGEPFILIDVREPHESRIARIPGARLMPLGELKERLCELDKTDDIVVHCRSGVRSAEAIEQMRNMGFQRLKNLKGGILSWSRDVDATVPEY